MKKLTSLLLTLSIASGMTLSAHAADYTFHTADAVDYYGSTSYESKYDAEYRYGGENRIDYEIPEIRYGLAQEFLEHSPQNPSLAGTQYGLTAAGKETYPSGISNAVPIAVEYKKAVTVQDLRQKDGSIGSVAISRVGLSAKVYEGTTDAVMLKGAGHYSGSALWDGNVALFGHNRGTNCAYFGALKNVKVGDTVKYKTSLGTRTYQVTKVSTISSTDYSQLNDTGDNRLTLITCVANQPSLRLCVQAVELK